MRWNPSALYCSVAIERQWIAAVSADPHGLDDRANTATTVIDEPGLTGLAAFSENHNQLGEVSHNSLFEPGGKTRHRAVASRSGADEGKRSRSDIDGDPGHLERISSGAKRGQANNWS
jgi:hypothetical protein